MTSLSLCRVVWHGLLSSLKPINHLSHAFFASSVTFCSTKASTQDVNFLCSFMDTRSCDWKVTKPFNIVHYKHRSFPVWVIFIKITMKCKKISYLLGSFQGHSFVQVTLTVHDIDHFKWNSHWICIPYCPLYPYLPLISWVKTAYPFLLCLHPYLAPHHLWFVVSCSTFLSPWYSCVKKRIYEFKSCDKLWKTTN